VERQRPRGPEAKNISGKSRPGSLPDPAQRDRVHRERRRIRLEEEHQDADHISAEPPMSIRVSFIGSTLGRCPEADQQYIGSTASRRTGRRGTVLGGEDAEDAADEQQQEGEELLPRCSWRQEARTPQKMTTRSAGYQHGHAVDAHVVLDAEALSQVKRSTCRAGRPAQALADAAEASKTSQTASATSMPERPGRSS